MKKIIASVLLSVALLSGCAGGEYKMYAESQVAIQTSKSNAEAERFRAMAAIAQTGDTTTKVAAMMALQQNSGAPQQTAQLSAPKSSAEVARDWLGIMLPAAVQGYGIHANSQVSINASNNAARVSESTNGAFVGIAGKIQAPVASIDNHSVTTTTSTDSHNTTTDNHAQTLSGAGTVGGGSYGVTSPAVAP